MPYRPDIQYKRVNYEGYKKHTAKYTLSNNKKPMVTTPEELERMTLNAIGKGDKVVLQGNDRFGWDTESVNDPENVHAYFLYQKRSGTGKIRLYINDEEIAWANAKESPNLKSTIQSAFAKKPTRRK